MFDRPVLSWLGVALAAAVVLLGSCPPIVAVGLGWAVAATVGAPANALGLARHLLAISVVALGFGLDLSEVLRIGSRGVLVSLLGLVFAFAFGTRLASRMGLRPHIAVLITAGTAICGGAAIAAVGPLIRARSADLCGALGVVFLLNAVALLVFPAVGTWVGLDAESFGTWCALAIHDTSSVVGAAAAHSEDALNVATIQKLARVMWIVPVGWILARHPVVGDPSSTGRPRVPGFLVAFLIAVVLISLEPRLRPVGEVVARGGRQGMNVALLAIGLGLQGSTRQVFAARPLLFGLLLWVSLASTTLAYVAFLES